MKPPPWCYFIIMRPCLPWRLLLVNCHASGLLTFLTDISGHDAEQSVAQDDSLPAYLLAVAVAFAGYLYAFLSRFLLLVSAIGTDDSVNRRRATKNVGDRNYGLAPLIFNGPGANHAYETTAKYMRHYETMSPKGIWNELNRNQGNWRRSDFIHGKGIDYDEVNL